MSDWLSDTVDGWSPDTVLLLQPYGMVEEVLLTYLHCGFDPLLHLTHKQTNDYEIYNRIFKFCCTDLSVSVWLYYIDGNDIIECGRLESAARLGCDRYTLYPKRTQVWLTYTLLIAGSCRWVVGNFHWYDFCTSTLVRFLKRAWGGVHIGNIVVIIPLFIEKQSYKFLFPCLLFKNFSR